MKKKSKWLVVGNLSAFLVAILMAAPAFGAGIAPGALQGKDQDNQGVVIKTPAGGFEASGTVKASDIGLPLYPGAKSVQDKDKDNGNLTFGLSRQGKPDVRFLVAKFETGDSIQQVRDFYQKKLGPKGAKFTEKDKDGGMAFELKNKDRSRYVQLKTVGDHTEIDLVRLDGADTDGDNIDIN